LTVYLDTSVIVSAFTNEVATVRARAFLHDRDAQPYLISWWVEAEISAAVYAKVGRGLLVPDQGRKLIAEIGAFVAESVICIPVEHSHFIAASDLARRSNGLRAGDALHLAIADSQDAAVCTLDVGMARAAEDLGLRVSLI
jgi:predicted nucleic acid-binding protein